MILASFALVKHVPGMVLLNPGWQLVDELVVDKDAISVGVVRQVVY